MLRGVLVQLVRLLFWNRHSTEQRVDLDEQDLTDTAAAVTSAAAVNAAYSVDHDVDTAVSWPPPVDHTQCHGLSLSTVDDLSDVQPRTHHPSSLSLERLLSVK